MEFGITENFGLFDKYLFMLGDYVEVWYDVDYVEFIEVVAWSVDHETNVLWLELEKEPTYDTWKDFGVDVKDMDDNFIDYIFYGTRKIY